MANESFVSELFRRRVPQFLGVYIAATWMAIEIGDWMTERFALPDSLTAFIFIGMLVLLPTVGVIAWGHGAPGRDQWTRFQVGFMGVNVLAAGLAIALFAQQQPEAGSSEVVLSDAPTETITLVDDAGNAETYEVAKSGFHKSLLAFFFANETGDPELDWLSYAAPWAVAEDLKRSPLISLATPLDHPTIIERLKATGYADAVGEPLSLNLQIARNRGLNRIVTGTLSALSDGALEITARLIDVETGQPLGQWSESGGDWLDAADRLSGQLREEILATVNPDTVVTELSIKEHTSENLEAVRLLVRGLRLRAFDNNYPGAIEAAEAAVAEDPSFALAHVLLSSLYRLVGDNARALSSARAALALDYKLYSETRFAMKANEQAIMGNTPQAIRMLERWAQIHPHSAQVQEILGNNYLAANRIEEAHKAFQRLYELAPDQAKILLMLSQTFRMLGKPEQALRLVENYLEDHRQDADALIKLGKTHESLSSFAEAREAFEEAAFVGSDPLSAQLALVKLQMREGRYPDALDALTGLSQAASDDRAAFQISSVKYLYHYLTGQVRKSLEELESQRVTSQSVLPPILQVFQVENQISIQLGALGDRDAALAHSEQLRQSLSPPFDSLTLMADLEIYAEFKDADNLEQVLEEIEQFLQRYQFPLFELIALQFRGEHLVLIGQYKDAIDVLDEVITEFAHSLIGLQEPMVVELAEIDKARALRLSGQAEASTNLMNDLVKRNPGLTLARLELVEALTAQGLNRLALNEARALDQVWQDADPEYSGRRRLDEVLATLEAG